MKLEILQRLLDDKYAQEFYENTLKNAIKKGKKIPDPKAYDNVSKILFPDNILERLLAKQERDEMNYIEIAKNKILSKAHDGQKPIITTQDNRIFILSERQVGKSEVMAMDIVLNATHKNTPMLYVVGSKSAAFDIIWRRIIDYSKFIALPIMKANKGAAIITWENGSEIKMGSSGDKDTIESLRGITRKCIYVDEIQKVKQPLTLINEVLMPMTNIYGNDYKFIITGTPPRARGTWFQKTWETDNTWTKFEMVLEQNPAIKDAALLRQEKKKTMLLDQYEREYEHKFSYSDQVVLFPTIKSNRWTLDELKPTHLGIGIDIGFSDSTAIVGTVWNKITKQATFLKYAEGHWTTDIIAKKIQEILDYLRQISKPYEIHKPARLSQLGHTLEDGINTKIKEIIVCDSSARLSIEDLRKYGIRVVGSQRTNKLEGINALQVAIRDRYSIDDKNLYEELEMSNWREKDDGTITDELTTTKDNHLDGTMATLYISREIER